jgi:transposase-like protein
MTSKLNAIECPDCKSTRVNKNGHKAGKQNHICVDCGRQFIDCYQTHQGYGEEVKKECLLMYVNGLGFRAIERIKGVHHHLRSLRMQVKQSNPQLFLMVAAKN